jgi:LacI family transcriptional regulator
LHRRATMADVAQVAGVSAATVSRVLAGIAGSTSDRTAANVRQIARELGYVVNGVAASLRSQQTRSIGLVLADVANPFFGRLAAGVENAMSEAGYGVILGNTSNSIEQEKKLVRLLIEKRVDALVIATSAGTGEHIQEAIDRGVLVVLVDSELSEIKTDLIIVDDLTVSRQVVEHLLDLGHRDVAIITGRLEAAFDRGRLEGYRDALEARGITFDPAFVVPGDSTHEGGDRAMRALLRLEKRRPTAVFVTNNLMTVGALLVIAEARLAIPRDISIVGFADMEWYPLSNPPITAVAQPSYEMGRIAAERLLLRLSRKHPPKPRRLCLNAELIIRASTAPPAQRRHPAAKGVV